MELGERLAKIRKEKGYKQKDLADLLHVSQQVISNIERNTTTPDINFLRGVADLYCMSIDELIGRQVCSRGEHGLEERIMSVIQTMDETRKELSLSLVNQVAQHRGNSDAK